jgi:hypothetical protein
VSILDTSQNVDEKVYIGDETTVCVWGTNNAIAENEVVSDVYHALNLSANLLFVYK